MQFTSELVWDFCVACIAIAVVQSIEVHVTIGFEYGGIMNCVIRGTQGLLGTSNTVGATCLLNLRHRM